jgi:hypothetical protein
VGVNPDSPFLTQDGQGAMSNSHALKSRNIFEMLNKIPPCGMSHIFYTFMSGEVLDQNTN